MTDDLITKYRDFILGLIKIPQKVKLVIRTKTEHPRIGHVEFGLPPKIPVNIEMVEKQPRSVKYIIKFDKYEKEFIFYISRKKSPVELLEKFENKIYQLVNQTIIEDENWELIETAEKERNKQIENIFKNKKLWKKI